jgi:hypothetical protein
MCTRHPACGRCRRRGEPRGRLAERARLGGGSPPRLEEPRGVLPPHHGEVLHSAAQALPLDQSFLGWGSQIPAPALGSRRCSAHYGRAELCRDSSGTPGAIDDPACANVRTDVTSPHRRSTVPGIIGMTPSTIHYAPTCARAPHSDPRPAPPHRALGSRHGSARRRSRSAHGSSRRVRLD